MRRQRAINWEEERIDSFSGSLTVIRLTRAFVHFFSCLFRTLFLDFDKCYHFLWGMILINWLAYICSRCAFHCLIPWLFFYLLNLTSNQEPLHFEIGVFSKSNNRELLKDCYVLRCTQWNLFENICKEWNLVGVTNFKRINYFLCHINGISRL